MLLFVPPVEFIPPPPRTKISKALITYETSQVGGVDGLFGRPVGVEGTHYTIDPDCTHIVRNMSKTAILAFRPNRTEAAGHLMLRFKFTGANPNYNFVSCNDLVTRARIWFSSKVAINVWHELRIEYGTTTKYYLDNVLMYSGASKGLPFFILNETITEAWFDTGAGNDGQSTYGGTLPVGYAWF